MNLPAASLAWVDVSYVRTGARVGGFFVYRFYDAAGQPVYIGQTKNPTSRMSDHGRNRMITSRATRLVLEEHDTREAAKMVEARAIGTERPLLNVHCNHSTPANDRASSEWDRIMLAKYGEAKIRSRDLRQARERAEKLRRFCSCHVCDAIAADWLANPSGRPYLSEVAS